MQKGWWAGQLKYSHRCLSSVLFKRRRPSPWNTCTTGAPSSSGRRRLRPVHQDRALSSTFLSDKSIRFKRLYIQIFEFRPLEFLKKLSPSPSYRFPCSQLAAPSEWAKKIFRRSKMSKWGHEFPLPKARPPDCVQSTLPSIYPGIRVSLGRSKARARLLV